MTRRRFEAPTLLEAVRAARRALGPEALVIAARRIPASRWPWGRKEGCIRIVARAPVAPTRSAGFQGSDTAWLEEMGRLADEVADLRRAVEALERSGLGTPTSAARRRSVRAVPNPSATPGSDDAWSRESSSS